MPGSISSVASNPPICALVVSVSGLIISLMISCVGFVNNAWIVYERPNYGDAFQRGIRGHDCYHKEKNRCLPWDFANKSAKFPTPFNEVLDASCAVHISYYIAFIIMSSQAIWIAYTFGNCCSLKFGQRVEKYRQLLFYVSAVPVVLWITLFFLIIHETYTDKIFPEPLVPTENNYTLGFGFWLFMIGFPFFLVAVVVLFNDKIKESKTKMTEMLSRRQRVPTGEELMER